MIIKIIKRINGLYEMYLNDKWELGSNDADIILAHLNKFDKKSKIEFINEKYKKKEN